MGADCKSAGYAYAGSNPARPKKELKKKSCEQALSSQVSGIVFLLKTVNKSLPSQNFQFWVRN